MPVRLWLVLAVLALARWQDVPAARQLIAAETYLGTPGAPEWDVFAGRTPMGDSLDLTFEAAANPGQQALLIRQADVKQDWSVTLNDRPLGLLARMEADLVHVLPVPPGALRDGVNRLRIASRVPDDIVIHEVSLHAATPRDLIARATLQVQIVDDAGRPMPGRVTILDARQHLAPVLALPGPRQAVRAGVAYTGGDAVRLGLPAGRYHVRATRGPEYAVADATIDLADGASERLTLRLRRDVPTGGWVATDTHIHTLTLSGHGDALLDERMLTLAGEGIELAVATEHDREADYAPSLAAMQVAAHVTPVVGSEVTTRTGHFNVFPHGGPVTVLNHPHDTHSGFVPFAPQRFHPVTGDSRGLARAFTAMEIVNSGAMRSDWMEPVRSWFALLSRGRLITPVGASDSHDVSRFIVGQARTYVRVRDDIPGRVPVAAAVGALRAGRVVVSLGLFATARIGTAGPGDLVPAAQARDIDVAVRGPRWIAADRVALFVNGREVGGAAIAPDAQWRIEKATLRWPLPRRARDYHVVVVASGPGVTHPSWAMARPYQPSSPSWQPVAFGVTGAIRVDADGDGVFSSARDYASRVVERHGDVRDVLAALRDEDDLVSAHAAELLDARGVDWQAVDVRTALADASPAVQAAISRFLQARLP